MNASRRQRETARGGYTLFEVLVALALSTFLIAAAYAALDLYWRLRTTGEEEVEQTQIARAILQRMEADLRATIYQASTSSDSLSASTTSTTSTSDDETAVAEVIDPTDANAGGNTGLMGDASSMVLSVSLPQSHANYAAVSEGPIGLPTSDLKSVTYLLAGTRMSQLAQAVADRFPVAAADGSGIAGLARIEGDRLLMLRADSAADVETIASQAQLMAAEVKTLQFEYTDGLDWFESWDSEVYGSLPRAVRITLSFEQTDLAAATSDAAAAKLYQLVVVLPPSDPISGSGSGDYETDENQTGE